MTRFIRKNIVVIGGTGTGKSSFLNNLALVLRFLTLEDAENGAHSFVPPIPVRMRFNNVSIVEGQDHNERSDQASSRTLRPQIYLITYGNVVFNLIDTPGMSDSKGQELDEEHVKHISTCIGEFKDIHGILLLLKSSDNTLNESSKYTFDMLLSCFGKTAGKVISFGITHAGYNKNKGGAPNVIKKYLEDLKNNPGIDCSDINLYCFESDPLFHVLSIKNGGTIEARERQVFGWSFENNVEELCRFFTKVVNRIDSYNARDIQTMIFARHNHPALASLVPFMGRKDQEYNDELDLIQKQIMTKATEIYGLRSNLMRIRKWSEPYEVQKIRYVDQTKNVTKQRIVKEEYMEEVVDIERRVIHGQDGGGGAIAGAAAGATAGALLGPLGMAAGVLFGGAFGGAAAHEPDRVIHRKVTREVPKTRDKVVENVEKVTVRVPEIYSVTKYRDREALEEDPGVRQSINRNEDERTQLMNKLLAKCSFYRRFRVEKDMFLCLLCDISLHLAEQTMVPIGRSGHLGASMELSSWIKELKRKRHWKPSDSILTLPEPMTRLRAMENSEHFGNEIKTIITKYREFAYVHYRVVDIPIGQNNPFMRMVLGQN